uniref:Uncharacterized protein n=1 Tax=Zonotrichia albicollis TaxID=44394 RepID=A0A8D2MYB0_ZONAL
AAGTLPALRLPRAGGALHPPPGPQERLGPAGQVEFQVGRRWELIPQEVQPGLDRLSCAPSRLLPALTSCVPYCPAGCRAPGGLPLLHRPRQVHLRALHLAVHHAARGAAPRQRPLQDGPDRALREAG